MRLCRACAGATATASTALLLAATSARPSAHVYRIKLICHDLSARVRGPCGGSWLSRCAPRW
eukprot:9180402-Prorocentrum_lima.AAC.1